MKDKPSIKYLQKPAKKSKTASKNYIELLLKTI
jgi:hypothetical protein